MAFTYTTKKSDKYILHSENKQMVIAAAEAVERGEITHSQFRMIARVGLAGEIRSTFQEKCTGYLGKYTQITKR